MQFFKLLSIWLFAVLPTAFAVPLEGNVVARQAATTTRASDPACTNGPRSRACWSDGFSIATDFDAKLPPNGKTRTVRFVNSFSSLVRSGLTVPIV